MISMTEGDDDDEWYLQSHLSLTLGWTGCKQHILNHILEKMLEMYQYNQAIPRVPTLEQTENMTLLELVTSLKQLQGLDDFFPTHAYTLSTFVPNTVGIKYIDGVNQIWRPRWAREARGRFYYIGDDYGVVSLKDTLQRGIEVLTKLHMDSGIHETQDIHTDEAEAKAPSETESSGKYKILDPIQQTVMKQFASMNTPIDSYLSCKVDGSLIIVNIYPKDCVQYEIMRQLIPLHGDDFTKRIFENCMSKDIPIVTISTQGTLFIGEQMQDYFLTAIQPLVGTIMSMSEWVDVLPTFVSRFLEYYDMIGLDNQDMCNFCFEAYCKDRLTITGSIHTELAVGYNHNGFNLLGMMNQGRYHPHFILPRRIFTQPLYLHVTNTNQVYELMKDLDDIVQGNVDMQSFYRHFSVMDEFTSKMVHPEGFVLLTPYKQDSITHYDYAKIKTQLYYKCHKVKQNNIKDLLALPTSSCAYYPILKNLHLFFDNTEKDIESLVERSFQSLQQEIRKDSILYEKLIPKAKARVDMVIEGGNLSILLCFVHFLCLKYPSCPFIHAKLLPWNSFITGFS